MIDGHLHHSSSGGGGGGGGGDHHSTSSLPSVKPPSHISHLTLKCSPLYQHLSRGAARPSAQPSGGADGKRRATTTTATSVGISVPRVKAVNTKRGAPLLRTTMPLLSGAGDRHFYPRLLLIHRRKWSLNPQPATRYPLPASNTCLHYTRLPPP